jgi:hypothetical protein
MVDLNHSQNLAVHRTGCLDVSFPIAVLSGVLERQSWLLFGWLLLATPVGVQAQFDYTATDSTITITGYTGTDAHVAIPSTIEGLPVTSLGTNAFAGSNLLAVTIPSSLTSIGVGAFSGCTHLNSVTIPNSVTSIGDLAFDTCASLTNVTILNGVTSIGEAAFVDCYRLTSVTIPNSVTSIGGAAFWGTSLAGVTIPSSVSSIGVGAFGRCSSLTAINVVTNNPAYSSVL